MPKDDYIWHPLFDEFLLCGAHFLDSSKLVADKEGVPLNDGETLIRETHCIGINVAPHGDNRRELFQLPDQVLIADVTCVDNMADTFKQFQDLLIQFAVCVGNDADERMTITHHESILEAKVCIVSTRRTAIGG